MFEGILQPWHLIILLAIVLIVFGPGKLGDVGSALGRGIREFRKSTRDDSYSTAATSSETSCAQCGQENPAGQRFCGQCGQELKAAVSSSNRKA